MLQDSQNKIQDTIKKGVIIHVSDEHYAQDTQILDRHKIMFGNVRDKNLGFNSIIIY